MDLSLLAMCYSNDSVIAGYDRRTSDPSNAPLHIIKTPPVYSNSILNLHLLAPSPTWPFAHPKRRAPLGEDERVRDR